MSLILLKSHCVIWLFSQCEPQRKNGVYVWIGHYQIVKKMIFVGLHQVQCRLMFYEQYYIYMAQPSQT